MWCISPSNAAAAALLLPTPNAVIVEVADSPHGKVETFFFFPLLIHAASIVAMEWQHARHDIRISRIAAVIGASDVTVFRASRVTSRATRRRATVSNALALRFAAPVAGADSIYPSVTFRQGRRLYLTALGQGFLPSAVIQWNSAARRPPSYHRRSCKRRYGTDMPRWHGVHHGTESQGAGGLAALTLT